MSTFRLAVLYLFAVAFVALTLNVFNVYSNFEEPLLGFVELSTFEEFIAPESDDSQQLINGDYINVNSAAINNFGLGFVGISANYFLGSLGQFFVPFLLMMLVIPPFFILLKKNKNKALRRRFTVLTVWVAGLICTIYFTAQYGMTNNVVISGSTKLILSFLTLACFSYAIWLLFNVYNSYTSYGAKEYVKQLLSILKYFVPILVGLLMIETLLLLKDVAVLFPTSPKSGGYWIAPQIMNGIINSGVSSLFTEEVSLGFLQRILSYTVLTFVIVMRYKSRNLPRRSVSKKCIKQLSWLIGFQIILSIISYFLLDLTFVGYLHHITSMVILVVTIKLVAISNVRKVHLKIINTEVRLNRYTLDVPVMED